MVLREQINNYKDALQWLRDNSELYDEISKIKSRYMRYVVRNVIVIAVDLLFFVAYFIWLLSMMPLEQFQGFVGAIKWYVLLVIGILVSVALLLLLYRIPLRLSKGYVEKLNSRLKENYRCLNGDTFSMMFEGGRCYVIDRSLGVRYRMKDIYEEGKCRLEHREWYEITGDYRIWRETDFCIVDTDVL